MNFCHVTLVIILVTSNIADANNKSSDIIASAAERMACQICTLPAVRVFQKSFRRLLRSPCDWINVEKKKESGTLDD